MRTLMVGIALAVGMVAKADASACTCMRPGPVQDELHEAAAVFSGRVVSIREDVENNRLWARVRVYEGWKGVSTRYVTVETELNTAACGYPLESGEYLFYAYERSGNRVSVNLCSRTAPLSAASEDLAILRRIAR